MGRVEKVEKQLQKNNRRLKMMLDAKKNDVNVNDNLRNMNNDPLANVNSSNGNVHDDPDNNEQAAEDFQHEANTSHCIN